LIPLSENGIIRTCSAIAERLRIHPYFECKRCISHVEKWWCWDSN
jgi:hypothetical protein